MQSTGLQSRPRADDFHTHAWAPPARVGTTCVLTQQAGRAVSPRAEDGFPRPKGQRVSGFGQSDLSACKGPECFQQPAGLSPAPWASTFPRVRGCGPTRVGRKKSTRNRWTIKRSRVPLGQRQTSPRGSGARSTQPHARRGTASQVLMAILQVVLTAVSPCILTFKEATQLSRSGHLSEKGFWENTMESP